MQAFSIITAALILPALMTVPALWLLSSFRDRDGTAAPFPLLLGLAWVFSSLTAALFSMFCLSYLPAAWLPLLCALTGGAVMVCSFLARRRLADFIGGLSLSDRFAGGFFGLLSFISTGVCAAAALPVREGPLLPLHLMVSGLFAAPPDGGFPGLLRALHTGAVNYDFINFESLGGPLYAGVVSLSAFLHAIIPAKPGSLLAAYGISSAALAGLVFGATLGRGRSSAWAAAGAVLLAPALFLSLPQSLCVAGPALGAVCLWGVMTSRFGPAYKGAAALSCLVYSCMFGPAGLAVAVISLGALVGAWILKCRTTLSGKGAALLGTAVLCLASAIVVLARLAETGPGRDSPVFHYAFHPAAGEFRFMYSSRDEMERRIITAGLAGDALSCPLVLGNANIGGQLKAHPVKAGRLIAEQAVASVRAAASSFAGGKTAGMALLILAAAGFAFMICRAPCAGMALFCASGTLPLVLSWYSASIVILLSCGAALVWLVGLVAKAPGKGQLALLAGLGLVVLGLDCAALTLKFNRDYAVTVAPLEVALRGISVPRIAADNPEAAKLVFPGETFGSSRLWEYAALAAEESSSSVLVLKGGGRHIPVPGYAVFDKGNARLFKTVLDCWRNYTPLSVSIAGKLTEVKRADTGDIPLLSVTYDQACSAQGQAQGYYSDGTHMFSLSVKDGHLDGPITYDYKKGIISLSGNYSRGRFSGRMSDIDPTGRTLSEGVYAGGLLNGPFTGSYPDGRIRLSAVYADGLPEGPGESYCPDGSRRAAINFLSGSPHGMAEITPCGGGARIMAVYSFGALMSASPAASAHEAESAALEFYNPWRKFLPGI